MTPTLDFEIEQISEREASFRKDYPVAWMASFVAPMVITACVLFSIGAVNEWATVGRVIIAAFATFFIFGRFVILFGRDSSSSIAATEEDAAELVRFLTSGELAVMVTYMDVIVALFVAFHMTPLFRLPWLGPKLAGVAADAKFILRIQPWMRKATFLGLTIFVMFPTSTTGSVGGSILGRILGLTRLQTLAAIFVGSMMGNGLMFVFSERLGPLKRLLQDSIEAKVIGIATVVLLIWGIDRWFRAVKKRYKLEHPVDV